MLQRYCIIPVEITYVVVDITLMSLGVVFSDQLFYPLWCEWCDVSNGIAFHLGGM